MTKNFSLFRPCMFTAMFALTVLILLADTANAQRSAGASNEKDPWTITYRVTIQTPDGCCDIKSEETTEGTPDKVTHYSFYRRFSGYYTVNGPHIYREAQPPTKLDTPSGSDTRRNPTLGDQLKSTTGEISRWNYSLVDRDDSAILARIKDIIVTDSTSETCGKAIKVHSESKSTFDGDIRSYSSPRDKIGTAAAGRWATLTLGPGAYYTIDFTIDPWSPMGRLDMVDFHSETKTTATDPGDASDEPPVNTKKPLVDYLNVHSKTLDGTSVKYLGDELQIKFCRKEPVTKFDAGDPDIQKDIEKNKTLSVIVEINISKGRTPGKFSDNPSCGNE